MRIAVISDVHGNSWALKNVLIDIEKKKADLIVNLGDSLYGPLNPKETYDLLQSYDIKSISGNQDRNIVENFDKKHENSTLRFVVDELNENAFFWLKSLPKSMVLDCGVFMCHGTPNSDTTYLLEKLCDGYVTVNSEQTIEELLQNVTQKTIFCGHSHTHRTIETSNKIIINSGSVGLQAYDDDLPMYHKIQNFNRNAHCCIVERLLLASIGLLSVGTCGGKKARCSQATVMCIFYSFSICVRKSFICWSFKPVPSFIVSFV